MRTLNVVVYDSNHLNPYGTELAMLLGNDGLRIEYWCPPRAGKPTSSNVNVKAHLAASSRGGDDVVGNLVRRLLVPLRIAFATPRHTPVIMIWVRDPWDALAFALRSILGGKTICIYHNPPSVRPRQGIAGTAERFLMAVATTCVVHSDHLRKAVEADAKSVRVAPHPPYEWTVAAAREGTQSCSDRSSSANENMVALVGALRPDKGSADLFEIAASANTRMTFRFIGPDRLDSSAIDQLASVGVTCEFHGPPGGASDRELVDKLSSSKVMLAPYRSVTASGTVHMAHTLGVPVLGYQSNGLNEILNPRSQAASPASLGVLLDEFLTAPWRTFRSDVRNDGSSTVAAWRGVLEFKNVD